MCGVPVSTPRTRPAPSPRAARCRRTRSTGRPSRTYTQSINQSSKQASTNQSINKYTLCHYHINHAN